MQDYRLHEDGVLRQADNAFIPNDPQNCGWKIYQQWLAEGNTPDPEYTLDELKDKVASAIIDEANTRVDAVTSNDPRAKRMSLAKAIKRINKKLDGNANQADLDYLAAQATIADHLENIEATAATNIAWAQDPARTEAELTAFDPATDITWPTMA